MNLDEMLTTSIEKSASDIHITPGEPPIFRIHGDLTPQTDMGVMDHEATQALVYGVMSEDQKKEFEETLELDYAYEVPGVSRFRINTFRQMRGVASVFRAIPETVPSLEELKLPDVFKTLLNFPNGLILVTGPTGSGKSTTLAAMIDYINASRGEHIITVEDPIEFVHKNKASLINQRQIGRDTRSFNAALKSALREDPDVILVGEMRDLETIRLALTAAETGHLVMGTLHTSSAPRTISRIVDVFPAGEKNVIRNMLSESLQGVICQALVKKSDGGRAPAFEIMIGTSAIRNLIREDKIAQMYSCIQTGSDAGMTTLDQYLQQLVANQVIDPEIALEAAINKDSFNS